MNEHHLRQLLERAEFFEQHNMWLHAVQVYVRILHEEQDNVAVAIRLANAYASMGNLDAAEQSLLNVLPIDKDNPDLPYALGMLFFRAQKFERAKYYFEQLIPARIPQAHYMLGLIYYQGADFISSERHLRLTLELNPDFPNAVTSLVEVLLRSKQADRAIPLLTKELEKIPDDWRIKYLLGNAYLQQQRLVDAQACYESVLRVRPDDVDMLCSAADVHILRKNYRQAQTMLERALEIDPTSMTTLLSLGRLAILKAEKRKAEKYFSRALEIDPSCHEALEQLQMIKPVAPIK